MKTVTVTLILGFFCPYANLVVAQMPEEPSQLTEGDMTLRELTGVAKNVVLQNENVEEDNLVFSHTQVVVSNVSGQRLVRFLLKIKNEPSSIIEVVLHTGDGAVESYMTPTPTPGDKMVDQDQARAAAQAFLTANEFADVPQSTASIEYMDFGSGGKTWAVQWETSAADGTPSDSVLVVTVDAVSGDVIGFKAPYDLEEDYGPINCTEAEARDTVRDEYGAAAFDAGEISTELRILNCAAWGIAREGQSSAKVWCVTILSPPGDDDRTKTKYVVDAKTGEVVFEHYVTLDEE